MSDSGSQLSQVLGCRLIYLRVPWLSPARQTKCIPPALAPPGKPSVFHQSYYQGLMGRRIWLQGSHAMHETLSWQLRTWTEHHSHFSSNIYIYVKPCSAISILELKCECVPDVVCWCFRHLLQNNCVKVCSMFKNSGLKEADVSLGIHALAHELELGLVSRLVGDMWGNFSLDLIVNMKMKHYCQYECNCVPKPRLDLYFMVMLPWESNLNNRPPGWI